MNGGFGQRLAAAVAERGPLCVGIDPHASLLAAWGLPDSADGVERFGRLVVEALGDRVAVLKPQSAFFERHGSAGVAALEAVVADARAAGALVVLDAKRGDIGSTAQAYADAYLGAAAPLPVDALTVSPFLGVGSLAPFVDTALANDRGVFVLALTSNPAGPEVQHARTAAGPTVAGAVLDFARARNAGMAGPGPVGCVVGATIGSTAEDLDVGGPLLAPGLGAQGASAADLRRVFGRALPSVLPSVSREVLRAGPAVADLRRAAGFTLAACRSVLGG